MQNSAGLSSAPRRPEVGPERLERPKAGLTTREKIKRSLSASPPACPEAGPPGLDGASGTSPEGDEGEVAGHQPAEGAGEGERMEMAGEGMGTERGRGSAVGAGGGGRMEVDGQGGRVEEEEETDARYFAEVRTRFQNNYFAEM